MKSGQKVKCLFGLAFFCADHLQCNPKSMRAPVAQLAEHPPCKRKVRGSIPRRSSRDTSPNIFISSGYSFFFSEIFVIFSLEKVFSAGGHARQRDADRSGCSRFVMGLHLISLTVFGGSES